jgi:tRNA pseudouridine32 synthase / 23S rRNA pseudouridine746 synthase
MQRIVDKACEAPVKPWCGDHNGTMQPNTAWQLRYADEHLLVADKPAGLLAVPGRGEDKQQCLWHAVQEKFPDALVVHRLDMATSGLIVFARSAQMQRQLSAAFARREVRKRYQACVGGEVPADQGQCDLPLAADWPRRPRQKVDLQDGKASLTHWTVLSREAGFTRLALMPVTGRSHQLRVHCAASGFPIVGDALYGGPPADRLMLHACELVFTHPVQGQMLVLESPAPF